MKTRNPTARQLAKHWDADGNAFDCVRNIVCHLDALLSDEMKERINWHDEQSVSTAVMRVLSELNDAVADVTRFKHAYETTTHDDCNCPVNSRHEIAPGCSVHDAASMQTDESRLEMGPEWPAK